MNFEHTYREILDGSKWRTSRIQREGETLESVLPVHLPSWKRLRTAAGRIKLETGRTYAVQVGRTAPTLRIRRIPEMIQPYFATLSNEDIRRMTAFKFDFDRDGWIRARIEIIDIRSERLQAISRRDAIGEGIKFLDSRDGYALNLDKPSMIAGSPEMAFAKLWDTIHTHNGERWQDNPLIFAIYFKLAVEG